MINGITFRLGDDDVRVDYVYCHGDEEVGLSEGVDEIHVYYKGMDITNIITDDSWGDIYDACKADFKDQEENAACAKQAYARDIDL